RDRKLRRWREPTRKFIAVERRPDRALRAQQIIGWEGLLRSSRGPIFTGNSGVHMPTPGFPDFAGGPAVGDVAPEYPRIGLGPIHARIVADNPSRQALSNGSSPENAARHAFGKPQVLDAGRRPAEWQFIRSHLEGAPRVGLDADRAQGRHPLDGPLP